jgi:hypothetical protein
MTAKRNLISQRFGRGVVIAEAGRTSNKNVIWKLRCDCGVEYDARSTDLIEGRILSCGCLNREILRHNTFSTHHGFARHPKRHPAYRSWRGMKNVCSNSADKNYGLYGGRGITFDQHWEKFTDFWADMGDAWEPGTRLKRNNTDRDFTAANCFWQVFPRQRRIVKNIKRIVASRRWTQPTPPPQRMTLGQLLWGVAA